MKKAVAMPCTKAQFEAMRPKLETIKGLRISSLSEWDDFPFIINNYNGKSNRVSNLRWISYSNDRTVYREFNEKIFLDACGYDFSKENQSELEQLKERLQLLEKQISHCLKIAEETQSLTNDEIDYSKIKTGSLVKVKGGGDKAFRVVIWNAAYYLGSFSTICTGDSRFLYFTFYDGCHFYVERISKNDEINFIEEVIEY